MKCNIGKIDRNARLILGAAIVIAGIYFQSWWGLVGLVFLVTAFTGFCPAYLPFGFSTKKETGLPAQTEEKKQ